MTANRDKQLEAKIRDRLERLGLNFSSEEKGVVYLSKLLYSLLSDGTTSDIGLAQAKLAKEEKVSLYELQENIGLVINKVDEEVLKSFYKAEDYNLKLMYDNIQLIVDDILNKG